MLRFLAAMLGILVAIVGLPAQEPETAAQPKLRFTIGKSTTRIEGPLDPDGRPDYAAALNDLLSQGITPQNNANVLLWQAIGPKAAAGLADEYFKRLGIEKPELPGNYFIRYETYLRDIGKLPPPGDSGDTWVIFDQVSQRPWKAADHPDVAEWLKVNAAPLKLVHEAMQRPHYFNPLVPGRDQNGRSQSLLTVLLPNVQENRGLGDALVKRAMLHLGEGRTQDAWTDLLTCLRLGRMVGRGGLMIELLVGIALEHQACRGMVALLQHAGADASMIESWQKALSELPPRSTGADKIDLGERYMMLDCFMFLDREGVSALQRLTDESTSHFATLIGNLYMQSIDWDPALMNAGKWYDRLVAAIRLPTRAERTAEFAMIEAELKEFSDKAKPGLKMMLGSGKQRGEAIGNILITLLIPAFSKLRDAEDRSEQTFLNLQVAMALARYQAENGKFPETLADLTPKFIQAVPGDLFSGRGLIYKPTDGGYVLYSVGVNGRDDDGRGNDDEPRGDDLVIRMQRGKSLQK